jgi:hypothetical protein
MSRYKKIKNPTAKKDGPVVSVTPVKVAKGFFESNLNFLRQRDPALAQRVETHALSGQYRVMSTGNPPRLNLLLPDGKSFFYAASDPEQDTRNELEKLNLKNTQAALFLGIGLGYELDLFLRDHVKKAGTTHLIIIEKEMDIFYMTLKTLDYASIAKAFSLHFAVGEKEDDLFLRLQEKFAADQKLLVLLKAMRPIFHSSSMRLGKEYYLRALRAFREAGAYQLNNFGNSIEDSLIGVRNMLENINEIIYNPGINLLFDQFKGKPGIVVSTGPSLNKNKHLLKGLEDKAVIVCPDASLRILVDIGVKPHLITSLERVLLLVKLVEGFTAEEVKDVFYAACPVVFNEAYQAYPGPRIIVYRNFDHFKWLKVDRGILDIKQSSGNMAFKILDALGCDPIILIGQDLAYSREGTTHASGSTFGEKQTANNVGTFQVMGNDGQPILTNTIWNGFRKSYEIDVAEYKGQCINATEGGAFIKGTTVMTFQEAIDKYISEPFSPLDRIKTLVSGFSKEEADRDAEKIGGLVDRTLDDMQHVYDTCKAGLDWLLSIDEVLEEIKKGLLDERRAKEKINLFQSTLTGYKAKVHERKENFQLFFMHIIQSFYLNFDIERNAVPNQFENEMDAAVESVRIHQKWFSTIGDTAMICVDLLKHTQETIHSKIHGFREQRVQAL